MSAIIASELSLTIAGRLVFDTPVRVSLATDAVAHGAATKLRLPKVGTFVDAGKPCGAMEVGSDVVELIAPISGRVTIVNGALGDDFSWLFAVLPTGEAR